MEYLKNKLISIAFLLITLSLYGQSYNYVYTDPCTLSTKTVTVPNPTAGVAVNYFGTVRIFTISDFSTGVFDNWLAATAQLNSSSPCQSVTTTIVNAITSTAAANTVNVVTSVVSVASVAQTVSSVTTGTISSTAGSVTSSVTAVNPSSVVPTPTSSTTTTSTGGGGSNLSNSVSNATDGGSSGGSASTGGSSSSSSEGGGSSSGGEQKSDSGKGGGSSNGRSRSNQAAKNIGSIIASGDIVAISNTDNTQNVRIVGSITHANTPGTRIKGILFSYTTGSSGSSSISTTVYKSWINKSRKLNTVAANTFMADFAGNFNNTLTVLESYKINGRLTGMFGTNFTAGIMGNRTLLNLSAVGGFHSNFNINRRIGTGVLVLGVYSPFTQYFEGSWWQGGLLLVPFNSWDIKLTKTFKLNISFSGVYEVNKSFMNYQVLTGGKINF